MRNAADVALVTTIKERCRVCYTCVRECPAKAIRISNGQAEVISERCIGCGNCIRVCSQQAKQVLNCIPGVMRLLASRHRVAACLAPSFPAEFIDLDYRRLVGMIRALGFDYVAEVAFGADLVAREYRRLLAEHPAERYIATTCPAVVGYVERYYPNLIGFLAPVVSPMLAASRALKQMYGKDLKIVFIGPCIAKKIEATSENAAGEVHAAITFRELREMFSAREIDPLAVEPSDFDPPRSGLGALFPISRGLLQAANVTEDLMAGEIMTANGRSEFQEAIREFETGDLDARLLEVLCCGGCIMGPGMTTHAAHFKRRSKVSGYVRRRWREVDREAARMELESVADLDLSRRFTENDHRIDPPSEEELTRLMAQMGKTSPSDELNCGACGYDTCRDHAMAIHRGLAESEMCLPYTIDQLGKTVKELAISHEKLASAQQALVQSEKLASMGQLAAGIAHEVNNPLGVVLLYSHLLLDECEEGSKMRDDLSMIAKETDRCKKIVAGLLNFARQNKVVLEPVDLREIVARSLKTMRTPPNVIVRIRHQLADPIAEIDGDQITQVLINLISNAYEAMSSGGSLTISTSGDEKRVAISVADTGVGIPEENRKKLFEPFFTTKQIGKGTGLGLAVSYGIVKMHRGDIRVESKTGPGDDHGTTFLVTLPRKGEQD
ncbi:MAG: [Fe-Fe] hydrogenase large subunit C-terminal domain-containing protein [Candidatus Eisenbacteria bacterium]|nr:[Fe-Fe] hydrogenase large subunit C-terminal domain-containing protein [Candidatus Eisenbacteria bacterium]